MNRTTRQFTPSIGIVTALGIEYLAVKSLVKEQVEEVRSGLGKCLFGRIQSDSGGKHSVVVVEAGMGNNMSALHAQKLLDSFASIDSLIMVGIAGAIPNP